MSFKDEELTCFRASNTIASTEREEVRKSLNTNIKNALEELNQFQKP